MTKISLITIGTELLKGTIINTNAAKAGQILRNNGYFLNRVVTISDEKQQIRDTVEQELAHSDVVMISGGLGPTKDDITKFTLAEIFNSELVEHTPTLEFLEKRYASRGRTLTRLTRQQAMVPASCTVVPNPKGTAPGMMFRREGKLLFSMPGVPFEMLHMVEFGILPVIQEHFPVDIFLHRIIRITGVPESMAAQRMETIEDQIDARIDIAYLPRHDGLWIELFTQLPPDLEEEGNKILHQGQELVRDLFAEEVYALGGDDLAKVLADEFHQKNLTLAIAESLTGGAISAMLVSVSGVSAFYKGSVTAYAVSVKEEVLKVPGEIIGEYGVVSAEVATAMAEGVRNLLKADIGIGTTGLAEKDGDTLPNAWLAYADQNGTDAMHIEFTHDRNVNIERAAAYAIKLCLKNVRSRFE